MFDKFGETFEEQALLQELYDSALDLGMKAGYIFASIIKNK